MTDDAQASGPPHDAEERRARRARVARLWRGPALAWLALIVLFAISLGSAYLPLGDGNVAANLLIAAVMIAILVAVLMDLRHAGAIIHVVAGTGLFWLILMFSLTFNDYLSRHY